MARPERPLTSDLFPADGIAIVLRIANVVHFHVERQKQPDSVSV